MAPPRDTSTEQPTATQELVLQKSPDKGFELVEKAMSEKGTAGVIEIAKQEADEAISGIHKLGTFDTSENYPGSAEEVLKMKTANEGAAKQVQEAVHKLELDLSEFGEAAKPVEVPKPVELKAEPVSAPVEVPKPVETAPAEAKTTEQKFDEMMKETESDVKTEAAAETKINFAKEKALTNAAFEKTVAKIAVVEAKPKPLSEADTVYLKYLQAAQENKKAYLDTLSADEALQNIKAQGDPIEEIRAEADFRQKREILMKTMENGKALDAELDLAEGKKSPELEEAMAEMHEMVGKQSGLKVEGEKLVEKSSSEKLDDEIEAEEERLKMYEQEAASEKKKLEEFTGGHDIGMTDLEKGYSASLAAHIAHQEAGAALTELMLQKLRMQKGNNSEGVKRIEAEIDAAEVQFEKTHNEATAITKEYEDKLKGIMNQPVEAKPAEVATAPVTAKKQEAQALSSGMTPSDFPLPKDASFQYAEAPKKEPSAVSKIWGKVWKSMKFWEV